MQCRKCKNQIPDESVFCLLCGAKQIVEPKKRNTKTRGNGTGTAFKLPNGKWRAEVTLWYDEDNKRACRTKSGFKTKKEALNYIPTLRGQGSKGNKKITLKALYEKWLPTHRATKSTMDCYKAAIKYFAPVWYLSIKDIDIDDLQECIDDCPKGKRTRENMKTVCGLLYKYGIPRGCVPENLSLAPFLVVGGGESIPKKAFTDEEVELIRDACGNVEYADYIYCLIYTGFRLGEFLSLGIKDYDREEKCIVGGAKTDAGKNRSVTISPKIQPLIDNLVGDKISGALFCDKETGAEFSPRKFRDDYYYRALEAAGIERSKERRLTPHCCRHTFATLMKRAPGADKDKLELIGHSSEEMLRYYQDVSLDDLRTITDAI